MPNKKTKDQVAFSLELPANLLEDVRKYAKADHRSLKQVFINALELLLHPDKQSDNSAAKKETQIDAGKTTGKLCPGPFENWTDATFGAFIRWINKSPKPALYHDLVVRRYEGQSSSEIAASFKDDDQVAVTAILASIDALVSEFNRENQSRT
jgi:hypothetical protein